LEEEVWLRVRRILVRRLDAHGFWSDDVAYQTYMQKQANLGEEFKVCVLREMLGKEDFAHLNSELIFGASNHRFRQRLPYMAAFGYELGLVMHTLLEGDDQDGEVVARLCAAFNIGIALFDHIIDSQREILSQLSVIINGDNLSAMLVDEKVCKHLSMKCNLLDIVEARILSKIVIWFFRELHTLYLRSNRQVIWKELTSYLLSAYHAEMESLENKSTVGSDLISLARGTSCQPFLIIFLLTQLSPSTKLGRVTDDFRAAVINLGEVFWLADDLQDIVSDLKSGGLNSILVSVKANIDANHTPDLKIEILTELLDQNYIETTADLLCTKIAAVLDFFQSDAFFHSDPCLINDFLTMYVRDWLR
jgi:hypothetical protein